MSNEQKKNLGEEKYDAALKMIKDSVKVIKDVAFVEKENNSGSSFFGPGRTRLLKLVKIKTGYKLELNVEVKKVENLTVLTEKEAKEKHMGSCRWLYSGTDDKVTKALVDEAIKGFIKTIKDKEAKSKTEEKKQEQKQEEKQAS